jgi:sialidase-1
LVLPADADAWVSAGRLERPLACGAVVSTPKGLVLAGGCDEKQMYDTVTLLTLDGGQARFTGLPALPEPVAYLEGVRLGNDLYVAGGQATPQATEAMRTFWKLDLSRLDAGWCKLEAWPGPARIMPRMAAQDGAVYLFSGAELLADGKGGVTRRYLADAYRYQPGKGWKRIADLPRPVAAAPVIAWGNHQILVFGGDDGHLADKGWTLADKHPGFSSAVLEYDTQRDRWSQLQEFPNLSVVTQASRRGNEILIPAGEDRPGHRTPVLYVFRERGRLPAPKPAKTDKKARQVGAASGGSEHALRLWPFGAAGEGSDHALQQTELWTAGQGGYHTYRIPALITLANGDVLAFCEGRKQSSGDSGDIDLLLRRSTDGGKTWLGTQTIVDDGPNTAGNPCPVEDRQTGRLWLTWTKNLGEDKEHAIIGGTSRGTRTVWVMCSDDRGVTWSSPREVTDSAKQKDWTWYATGPGVGIQLQSGRLLIPCDHAAAGATTGYSHAIYSDDHGETWRIGGVIPDRVNECQAVELADGTVVMNMRSYHELRCRAVAASRDGGTTWGPMSHHPMLIEPVCQASVIRLDESAGVGKNTLAFSNPASRSRQNMTVRLSFDGGETWPVAKSLHAGPVAYSSLTTLRGGDIACLYERGEQNPYEKITFARFGADWLMRHDEGRH